jgi:beta-N-acetylhexosaminidase
MRFLSTPIIRKSIIISFIINLFIIPFQVIYAAPKYQDQLPSSQAQELLETLSPEEKVGQLFLVNFYGDDIGNDSDIARLISKYHIGGVVLKNEYGNFPDSENPTHQVWGLANALQQKEFTSSLSFQTDPETGNNFFPEFIPLFIGINQNGNGYPNDTILQGVTKLPSPLAIGATWDPSLSKRTGEILGNELSAIGINFLLGPSLNVIESPNANAIGDLQSTSFGGDPFWVGYLGQSYIEGIQTGSDGKITVIAKHFPGFGGAENLQEDEIPTISKAFEQLIQVELQPFFSVTGLTLFSETSVDGLLLSHTRYQALQENVSSTTRPLSFDGQAFSELMELPILKDWYADGGLIVSDELGTRAIRKFYDPTELVFNARTVARDAFLAGNDILNTGNFVDNESLDLYKTLTSIISFFSQKYREDIAFAQQVDESVLKILTKKFEMYPSFGIEQITPPVEDLVLFSEEERISFEVAIKSATLLSPNPGDLDAIIPSAPAPTEEIVIITDTSPYQICEECEIRNGIEVDALQKITERLYDLQTGGETEVELVSSYSFKELNEALNSENNFGSDILNDIRSASWLIFLAQKQDSNIPDSLALSRLLSERTELLQNKKSIVFAVDAPYYLDATEISKISVYYGVYSKQPQFIEVIARLIFKELTAVGASPVNIDGIGYDLSIFTSPDPSQNMPVLLYPFNSASPPSQQLQDDLDALNLSVGDPIRIVAGPILDFNGNIVPDGTPIEFILNTERGDGTNSFRTIGSNSRDGFAQTLYRLELGGALKLTAINEASGTTSLEIRIEVGDSNPNGNATNFETETPISDQGVEDNLQNSTKSRPIYITLGDWLLTIIVIFFVTLFSYQIAAINDSVRWGIRWGLTSLIGGLVVLGYFSFNLSGTAEMINLYDIWGIVGGAGFGSLFGLAIGWLWKTIAD